MPFVIEDGTGVPNANSYVSVAQADAYLSYSASRVQWLSLTTPDKEAYLVQAARLLDSSVVWKGDKVSASQAMAWPRSGVDYMGEEWPSNSIPPAVLQSQMELAALQMAGDRSADPASKGIDSVSVGGGAVSVKFNAKDKRTLLGTVVPNLLSDWSTGVAGAGFAIVPIRRV